MNILLHGVTLSCCQVRKILKSEDTEIETDADKKAMQYQTRKYYRQLSMTRD